MPAPFSPQLPKQEYKEEDQHQHHQPQEKQNIENSHQIVKEEEGPLNESTLEALGREGEKKMVPPPPLPLFSAGGLEHRLEAKPMFPFYPFLNYESIFDLYHFLA